MAFTSKQLSTFFKCIAIHDELLIEKLSDWIDSKLLSFPGFSLLELTELQSPLLFKIADNPPKKYHQVFDVLYSHKCYELLTYLFDTFPKYRSRSDWQKYFYDYNHDIAGLEFLSKYYNLQRKCPDGIILFKSAVRFANIPLAEFIIKTYDIDVNIPLKQSIIDAAHPDIINWLNTTFKKETQSEKQVEEPIITKRFNIDVEYEKARNDICNILYKFLSTFYNFR